MRHTLGELNSGPTWSISISLLSEVKYSAEEKRRLWRYATEKWPLKAIRHFLRF